MSRTIASVRVRIPWALSCSAGRRARLSLRRPTSITLVAGRELNLALANIVLEIPEFA